MLDIPLFCSRKGSRGVAVRCAGFLWVALAVVALATCGRAGKPTREGPPNVVVIVADTLRADALGMYGDKTGASRELDKLAKKGVVFDRVIAPSSWTKPSVGSILTGAYPRSLGLYLEQDQILPDSANTLAEILHENGYRTVGLTANPNLNPAFNFDQGFDTYVGSTVLWPWMIEEGESESALQHRLKTAREIYRRALQLVREKSNQPTFLFVDLMEMHEHDRGEYQLARQEFRRLYPGKPFAPYWHALRQISVDTSWFLNRLRKVPGWSDTLVVFVSDHGEGLGDHPAVHRGDVHGYVLYESNVSVPMFWYRRGSDLKPTRIHQPVRLIDLAPTLVDYLGIQPTPAMDGSSLLPLLRGESEHVDLPEYFFVETYFRGSDKQGIYAPNWGYFEHHDNFEGFDPQELQANGAPANGAATNVIDDHPDEAAELADGLHAWESAHPKAPPTATKDELSEEELKQLQSIGYM